MTLKVEGKKIPDWAGEFGAKVWSQFFLKFVVSHTSVTSTLSATSKPVENVPTERMKNGGGKRSRTADLCTASATLYQLSYTPNISRILVYVASQMHSQYQYPRQN